MTSLRSVLRRFRGVGSAHGRGRPFGLAVPVGTEILRDTRRERPGPARVARRPHGLSARKGRAAQAAQVEQRRLARAKGQAGLSHGPHSGPANAVRQLEKRSRVQTVRWNRLRQTWDLSVSSDGDQWLRRLAMVDGAQRADVFVYAAAPDHDPEPVTAAERACLLSGEVA